MLMFSQPNAKLRDFSPFYTDSSFNHATLHEADIFYRDSNNIAFSFSYFSFFCQLWKKVALFYFMMIRFYDKSVIYLTTPK